MRFDVGGGCVNVNGERGIAEVTGWACKVLYVDGFTGGNAAPIALGVGGVGM